MQNPFIKTKNHTKNYSFPTFSFFSHLHVDTMARGDSHKCGSASTVLNSPHNVTKTFKNQEWMSDGYLDSIVSLPLGAHADEGLTDLNTATQIVSVEEIEDEDDLHLKDKEKLDLTGPLLESVIPADWLLEGHFV